MEHRHKTLQILLGGFFSTAKVFIVCLFIYYTLSEIKGTDTSLSIIAPILGRITTLIMILALVFAVVWALAERKLRQNVIKTKAREIKALETRLDARRSSSRLTAEGSTNPEDN